MFPNLIFKAFSLLDLLFALAKWFSWLEHHTIHQKMAGTTPGRAYTWVVDSIPGWGAYRKKPIDVSHGDVSLSSPSHPPSPLSKINKLILRWVFFKNWLFLNLIGLSFYNIILTTALIWSKRLPLRKVAVPKYQILLWPHLLNCSDFLKYKTCYNCFCFSFNF